MNGPMNISSLIVLFMFLFVRIANAQSDACPCYCQVRPICPATCTRELCAGPRDVDSDFNVLQDTDGNLFGFTCCDHPPIPTPTPSSSPIAIPLPSFGGSDQANGDAVLIICVQFFINNGFGCAKAKVFILECGIVLTITTFGNDCKPRRKVFEDAYASLLRVPNFENVFIADSNELDYDDSEYGVSTLKLFFNK